MISLGQTFNSEQVTTIEPSQCFDIQTELGQQAYGLTFEVFRDHGTLVSALSDYSLAYLDISTLQCINHIPGAHEKRINDIHLGDKLIYTSSNDGSIRIWDMRAESPLVGECKGIKSFFPTRLTSLAPSRAEIYCLSQVKHILAGGTDPNIHFWDLRKVSLLNTFDGTHGEEVTSLHFFPDKASILLSSSLDGIVCLFDLAKEDEEEAADTVLRLEQPVNSCKFLGDNFSTAFAQTTVQTLALISLEEAKIVKNVNTIENLDTNEFALLGAYTIPERPNLYYLRGNLEGYIEEYEISLFEDCPASLTKKFRTNHKGPITKAERISNDHILSAGEDFLFCITKNTEIEEVFEFEEVKKAMFYDDDTATDTSNSQQINSPDKNGRRMRLEFNPY